MGKKPRSAKSKQALGIDSLLGEVRRLRERGAETVRKMKVLEKKIEAMRDKK